MLIDVLIIGAVGAVAVKLMEYLVQPLFYKETERVPDDEKGKRILMWKKKDRRGWMLVVAVNIFCVCWLTVFANEYSWNVVEKWVSAAGESLFFEFVINPIGSAMFLAPLIVSTKFFSRLDCFFAYFPNLLPKDTVHAEPPDEE